MFRNLLIIVAVFGLGWGASFGAGVAFGRRSVPAAQAAASPTNVQVQVPTGQGGPGGQGGARIAVGTVERLDGQTLVISANNQQTRVALNAQTQILKQAAGTTADLTAGTQVTVQAQGQPAADGTLTAATIMIGAPGAGGAAFQRPAGQQGQQPAGR